jgi:LmbE family N-acetylglucosaminyl deacetylase
MTTSSARRLMVVAAHPDDETLGFGAVLALYAARGVETFLVTATRGERGRYNGVPQTSPDHPGAETLARIRERELRDAAAALGIRCVCQLDFGDQQLDGAPVPRVVAAIASEIRRVRPQVVITFPPDGSYGHPDHIAVSQFTAAAIVAAADAAFSVDGVRISTPPHTVSKMYYLAWDETAYAAYQAAFKKLTFTVDGVERQANAWPTWSITSVVETKEATDTVWKAVACHASQTGAYEALRRLEPQQRATLFATQSFYRVFSLVNGGRQLETDLFEGL